MTQYQLPMPEVFGVSTLLRPLAWIRPVKLGSYIVDVDMNYAPTDIIPRDAWVKRLDDIDRKVRARKLGNTFASFAEAYNFVYTKLDSFPAFEARKVAKDPLLSWDPKTDALVGAKDLQFFLNYATNHSRDVLILDWDYFWQVDAEYQANPKSFYRSYEWVNNHPMFWKLEGDPKSSALLHWSTNNAFDVLWHSVFYDQHLKSVVHQIEGGPNVCQSITYKKGEVKCLPSSMPTLDVDLTVQAGTYEEVIIAFAKVLNAQYPLVNMDSWLYSECRHSQDIVS